MEPWDVINYDFIGLKDVKFNYNQWSGEVVIYKNYELKYDKVNDTLFDIYTSVKDESENKNLTFVDWAKANYDKVYEVLNNLIDETIRINDLELKMLVHAIQDSDWLIEKIDDNDKVTKYLLSYNLGYDTCAILAVLDNSVKQDQSMKFFDDVTTQANRLVSTNENLLCKKQDLINNVCDMYGKILNCYEDVSRVEKLYNEVVQNKTIGLKTLDANKDEVAKQSKKAAKTEKEVL